MTRMATALIALTLLAAGARAAVWSPPAGLEQTPLWPGTPPGAAPGPDKEAFASDGKVAGAPLGWVTDVSRPTMTVYPAKGRNTGAAVLVFPGGGFMGLAIDLEGTEVCDRLAPEGVTCAVVKYRVPRSEDYYDKALGRHVQPKVPAAFQDAQRSIRLLRANAARWGVDPRKVGVLGFSAGGWLAAKTAVEAGRPSYGPVDSADALSARPDFSAPVYPGHLWKPREGSDALTLNPVLHVSGSVPPTFLVMAEDDRVDHVEQALTYYRALQKAGAPVEMHLYARGGHAFGLRPTKDPVTRWPALFEAWLRTIGMVKG